MEDIGEGDDALLCITSLVGCFEPFLGNWFFPNGTTLPSGIVNATSSLQWDLGTDSNHDITSQVTDPVTATYTNTLTVTGRLAGQYECSVSNSRTPSGSTRSLTVVGKECSVPHGCGDRDTLRLSDTFLTNSG